MEPVGSGNDSVASVVNVTPTAWFEFVLDETLLERHLAKPDAGTRMLHEMNLVA
jgi:hypothetical protein